MSLLNRFLGTLITLCEESMQNWSAFLNDCNKTSIVFPSVNGVLETLCLNRITFDVHNSIRSCDVFLSFLTKLISRGTNILQL